MSDSSERSNVHFHEAFQDVVVRGGLFDVGPNDLDDDIGRRVRFPDAEEDPEDDSLYNYEHVIVAVQKDFQGELCYRVQVAEEIPGIVAPDEDLGRVARPDEVEFVE